MDIATDAAVGVLPLNVPQRMTFDGHPSPDPFPADTLGVGVPNVTSLIHRLRQRHAQLVREEVERTVLDPAEVEAELHGLCEALVQAEGRVRS